MSSRPSAFTLTSPGALRLYSTAELLRMPRPEWQIEPIIPAGGLVGLYGPPGCGKSFIAIDMVMSLATGKPWQGHTVNPDTTGFGLYVAAEGGVGIVKRVHAWLSHTNTKPSQAPVGWLMEAMPLYGDSEDLERFIDRVGEVERAPKVIVIDTLARCFDGDENQQLDMGRFITGVDRLRHQFNTTVIVVHHTRLDGERERGNTAFRGAADTMISVSGKGGEITLKCSKQKDAEEFEDIDLKLQTVKGTESCVIAGLEDSSREKQHHALTVLEVHGPLKWDEWLNSTTLSRGSFQRAQLVLRDKGEIIKENGKWRVTPTSVET